MKYAAKQKTSYKVQKSGKTIYAGNDASAAKNVAKANRNTVISFRSEVDHKIFNKANRQAFT